jgi:hypothetical protein
VVHYNQGRPHASLGSRISDVAADKLAQPNGHQIPAGHHAVATPILGGLHHEYRWKPVGGVTARDLASGLNICG